MADKKIIAYMAVSGQSLDDYTKPLTSGEFEGLNSKAKRLIDEGFVPFGELKLCDDTFFREFVKYEE